MLLLLLNLKIDATCSYETSVEVQLTKWFYLPEDNISYYHRCENLK
jgi:hypothetical protein